MSRRLGLLALLCLAACSRNFDPAPPAQQREAPAPLQVSPASLRVAPDEAAQVDVAGGVPPYAVQAEGGGAERAELSYKPDGGGTITYRPGFRPFASDRFTVRDDGGSEPALLTASVGEGFDVDRQEAEASACSLVRVVGRGGQPGYGLLAPDAGAPPCGDLPAFAELDGGPQAIAFLAPAYAPGGANRYEVVLLDAVERGRLERGEATLEEVAPNTRTLKLTVAEPLFSGVPARLDVAPGQTVSLPGQLVTFELAPAGNASGCSLQGGLYTAGRNPNTVDHLRVRASDPLAGDQVRDLWVVVGSPTLPVPLVFPDALAVGNLNADVAQDLLAYARTGGPDQPWEVSSLLGGLQGPVYQEELFLGSQAPSSPILRLADLNGDGLDDLLVAPSRLQDPPPCQPVQAPVPPGCQGGPPATVGCRLFPDGGASCDLRLFFDDGTQQGDTCFDGGPGSCTTNIPCAVGPNGGVGCGILPSGPHLSCAPYDGGGYGPSFPGGAAFACAQESVRFDGGWLAIAGQQCAPSGCFADQDYTRCSPTDGGMRCTGFSRFGPDGGPQGDFNAQLNGLDCSPGAGLAVQCGPFACQPGPQQGLYDCGGRDCRADQGGYLCSDRGCGEPDGGARVVCSAFSPRAGCFPAGACPGAQLQDQVLYYAALPGGHLQFGGVLPASGQALPAVGTSVDLSGGGLRQVPFLVTGGSDSCPTSACLSILADQGPLACGAPLCPLQTVPLAGAESVLGVAAPAVYLANRAYGAKATWGVFAVVTYDGGVALAGTDLTQPDGGYLVPLAGQVPRPLVPADMTVADLDGDGYEDVVAAPVPRARGEAPPFGGAVLLRGGQSCPLSVPGYQVAGARTMARWRGDRDALLLSVTADGAARTELRVATLADAGPPGGACALAVDDLAMNAVYEQVPGVLNLAVALGDFNGDRLQDVAVSGPNRVTVISGGPGGRYATGETYLQTNVGVRLGVAPPDPAGQPVAFVQPLISQGQLMLPAANVGPTAGPADAGPGCLVACGAPTSTLAYGPGGSEPDGVPYGVAIRLAPEPQLWEAYTQTGGEVSLRRRWLDGGLLPDPVGGAPGADGGSDVKLSSLFEDPVDPGRAWLFSLAQATAVAAAADGGLTARTAGLPPSQTLAVDAVTVGGAGRLAVVGRGPLGGLGAALVDGDGGMVTQPLPLPAGRYLCRGDIGAAVISGLGVPRAVVDLDTPHARDGGPGTCADRIDDQPEPHVYNLLDGGDEGPAHCLLSSGLHGLEPTGPGFDGGVLLLADPSVGGLAVLAWDHGRWQAEGSLLSGSVLDVRLLSRPDGGTAAVVSQLQPAAVRVIEDLPGAIARARANAPACP